MKMKEIAKAILDYHPNIGEREATTVDTFKSGDPEAECTGIVTTIWPTIEVIKKTHEMGYNLIIPHEPTFYNNADKVDWWEDNSVYLEKLDLLKRLNITIWRDHDHLHAHKPDGIRYGVMKELGWEDYLYGDPDRPTYFKLPRTTVRELALFIKEKLMLNMVRVIGNLDSEISTVHFGSHAYPLVPDNRHINILEKGGVDVLIPGELIDWTVTSYVYDAVQLGRAKAILSIGHFNGENLAMKYAGNWISTLINHAVPITYINAGDMFNYV